MVSECSLTWLLHTFGLGYADDDANANCKPKPNQS